MTPDAPNDGHATELRHLKHAQRLVLGLSLALAMIVAAALSYELYRTFSRQEATSAESEAGIRSAEDLQLLFRDRPADLPDVGFVDGDGRALSLRDFRGRRVILNIWATWCVPCRKEMPALDSLQTKLGGKDFEVIAINIDTRDPEKPKNFLKEANLTRLGYFTDTKAKVFQDLKNIGKALGMPTSVLVDGQGCEIGTIAGPAEWASDDALALIKAAVKPATAGF